MYRVINKTGIIQIIFINSLIVCFSIYTIIGCSSSRNSVNELEQYDTETYADVAVFPGQVDIVFQSSVLALQSRGYNITITDQESKVVVGELGSSSKLKEEQQDHSTKSTFFESCLAIVLLIGVLVSVFAASDNNSSDDNSSLPSENIQTPDSYKYIVTLTHKSAGSDSTEVSISVFRTDYVNGDIIDTVPIENKYINYEFFDAIHDGLTNSKDIIPVIFIVAGIFTFLITR